MRAVVGCSVGTGWVVLVTIVPEGPGDRSRITVLDRQRVDLVSGNERFAYHNAAERELPEAEQLVAAVGKDAAANAGKAAERVLAMTRAARARLSTAVVIGAAPAPAPLLAEIVRTHAAIHTAEGVLYRTVVAQAFTGLGIDVLAIPRQDLLERTAETIGAEPSTVEATLKALGHQLGPPWRKEQKEAALAAWSGLARVTRSARAAGLIKP